MVQREKLLILRENDSYYVPVNQNLQIHQILRANELSYLKNYCRNLAMRARFFVSLRIVLPIPGQLELHS